MSSSIAVAISYIFIVVLAGVLVKTLFALSDANKTLKDLKTVSETTTRRLGEIGAAVAMMQSGLLNLSAGAQTLLASTVAAAVPKTIVYGAVPYGANGANVAYASHGQYTNATNIVPLMENMTQEVHSKPQTTSQSAATGSIATHATANATNVASVAAASAANAVATSETSKTSETFTSSAKQAHVKGPVKGPLAGPTTNLPALTKILSNLSAKK